MAFLLVRSNGRHIKIASLDCGRELPHFVEAVDGIAAGSRQYWVNNTINIETLGSNLHLNCLMFINSGSRTMWTTTTPLDRNYTHHMSAICQRRSITIKSNGFISSRRDDNYLDVIRDLYIWSLIIKSCSYISQSVRSRWMASHRYYLFERMSRRVAEVKASIPVRCVDPPSIVQFPAVIVLMIDLIFRYDLDNL